MPITETQQVIRNWVIATAYAENDFVLTFDTDQHAAGNTSTGRPQEVIELLDKLDPDWRSAFK